MKRHFKLVALDLDGTLFNSQSSISDKNKEAIKAASATGTTFVIATGRPYRGLPLDDMKELGIEYAITSNGAAIYKVPEKKCLMESCMPWSLAADIADDLLTLPIHMDLFMEGDAYTPEACRAVVAHMNHLPQELKNYIMSTRKLVPDISKLIRSEHRNVQKSTLNFPFADDGTPLYRDKAMEILNRYPEVTYLSGGFGNLEFTKKGISKAKGLSFLCDYLNISIAETIACGDSENDLDIIKAAGLGIAMNNAMDNVKSQADEVAPSNDEDGVAAIIMKWVL